MYPYNSDLCKLIISFYYISHHFIYFNLEICHYNLILILECYQNQNFIQKEIVFGNQIIFNFS